MPEQPEPISAEEQRARLRRVRAIASRLGFQGRVEYRHVFSNAGGAQYGIGVTAEGDLLIVYADAFERDANPEDYSLDAIIAHERGHQILCREARISRAVFSRLSSVTEEIVASLIGSLIATDEEDRDVLLMKALGEALECGVEAKEAYRLVINLHGILEKLL
jgi:hypothetical protein